MNKEQDEIVKKLKASFDAMTPKKARKGGLINIDAINGAIAKSQKFIANIEAANIAFDALRNERAVAAFESVKDDLEALGLVIRMTGKHSFKIGTRLNVTSDKTYVCGMTTEFTVTSQNTQHHLDGGLYVGELHTPKFKMETNEQLDWGSTCDAFEPFTREASFINRITSMVGSLSKQKAA